MAIAKPRFLRGMIERRFTFIFIVSTLFHNHAQGNEIGFSELPTFDIGRTVNLEAVVSCSGGFLNSKQGTTLPKTPCASADEGGESNRSRSQLYSKCLLACDPTTGSWLDINGVLLSAETNEWISFPKRQNSKLQELNITINFPQLFKVQRISLKAGQTSLPAVWSIEKLPDFGGSFEPVRYYSTDCSSYFGVQSTGRRMVENETEINSDCVLRPDTSWEETVEVNFEAAAIQLKFLKMQSVSNGSESNLDYYSVRRISIEGSCVCNGLADDCTMTEGGTMTCHCQHNTCGQHCQTCCAGFSRNDALECVESVNKTELSTEENESQDSASISEAVENGVGSSVRDHLTIPQLEQKNDTLRLTLRPLGNETLMKNVTVSVADGRNNTLTMRLKNRTRYFTVSPLPENITIRLLREGNRTLIASKENFTAWQSTENSTLLPLTGNVTVQLVEELKRSSIANNITVIKSKENITVLEPIENGTASPSTKNVSGPSAGEDKNIAVPTEDVSTREKGTASSSTKHFTFHTTTEKSMTRKVPAKEFTTLELPENGTVSPSTEITTPFTVDENGTLIVLSENSTVSSLSGTEPLSIEETRTLTGLSPFTRNNTAPIEIEKNKLAALPTGSSTIWKLAENRTLSSIVDTVSERNGILKPTTTYSSILTLTESADVASGKDDGTLPPATEVVLLPTLSPFVLPTVSSMMRPSIEPSATPATSGVFSVPTAGFVTVSGELEGVITVQFGAQTTDESSPRHTGQQSVKKVSLHPVETSVKRTVSHATIEVAPVLTSLYPSTAQSTADLFFVGTMYESTGAPTITEDTTVQEFTHPVPSSESVSPTRTTDGSNVPYPAYPTPKESTTKSTSVLTSKGPTSAHSSGEDTTVKDTAASVRKANSIKATPVVTGSQALVMLSFTNAAVEEPSTIEATTGPLSTEDITDPLNTHITPSLTSVRSVTEFLSLDCAVFTDLQTSVLTSPVEPSTLQSTTPTTTMQTTTEPITPRTSTDPGTQTTSRLSTTQHNTTEATTAIVTSMSSAMRPKTEASILQSYNLPTILESAAETSNTTEHTSVPSTAAEVTSLNSTAVPTTLRITPETGTWPSATQPSILRTTTNYNTLRSIAVPTTLRTTSEHTALSSSAVPTTRRTTIELSTLLSTTVTTTLRTTSVKITTEPSTLRSTSEPPKLPSATVPTTLRTSNKMSTLPSTNEPSTLRTTFESATFQSTARSSKPTTPAPVIELSEEEARIAFGNLPKGVCYCSKFATLERQCFPKALHKPCLCRANFNGTRCERCALGFFNYPFCIPCRCNAVGSISSACGRDTGRCYCKPGVGGRKCDACPLGYYNFPACLPCDCNPSGSYGSICDPYTGKCRCRYGVRGRQCDMCPAGYYRFPNCQWCGCNPLTTTENICEEHFGSYRCLCRSNFKGLQCGECRKGFYDFPICKRCSCSPLGYGSCNQRGECVCDEGFAGSQCDRCADGFYGFPNCRACNCNGFGSYSKLCNESTGQCQCKVNIRAKQCDRCAEGMVGFPVCVKCECNPDGTSFLPGITSDMCFGTDKYQCLCKPNVVGRTCDRCQHGHFNFSASNPLGCSSCGCSTRGTISGTRHCHAQTGRCNCKNHVIGRKCDNCRNGYHGVRSHDIFGCRACKCNPGGSVSRDCFKHLGDCRCLSGVTGKKCNRLLTSRPLYFPTLYHIFTEFENAVLMSRSRTKVPIGADTNTFPSFTGRGYAILTAYKAFIVAVSIPKTRKYRIIFHYVLKDSLRVSAKVELFAPGAKSLTYGFEVQFSSPSGQQTKNMLLAFSEGGFARDFLMEEGSWRVAITSHSSIILLDYIVFLPEDYYKAELLQDVSPGPCVLRDLKAEHCDMYTYYESKSPSFVTVSGDSGYRFPLRGHLDTFRDPRFNLIELGLPNMALLGRNQPTIGFDIFVPESGLYILLVKYLHPEKFIQRVFVTVGFERGMLEILPCKYQFACRQFAMDDRRRARAFEMKRKPEVNVVKLESSGSAKLAVISVTAIPQARWNPSYVLPALLCRMFNKSCVFLRYRTPKGSIQLNAFSQRNQEKVISIFTGFLNVSGSYHIIVRYHQSNSLSTKFEQLSITGHASQNTTIEFQYCPAQSGCRVVVGEEENLTFQLNRGLFTATIQHERRTHVGYILLVPKASFSSGLTELLSSDKVATFLHDCGKEHFYINPTQDKHCREDVFSLTVHFNGQPLPCKCNVLGSQSTFCEQFGGQCRCRPNIIGRRCDRCRLGYSGFPRCRRCGCHDVGSLSLGCTSSGRCFCKKGFGGYKCDRCISSGYYGFPDCKPCACDDLGSLSEFCRSRDGQCQCRRKFQGRKCSECRIGFYDFPECKECNCNPAGIKLLAGQKNGCGYVNKTYCTCKDNVQGNECDSCKEFHFDLQINNPLGCQRCDCDTNGTLGSIKSCHQSTGQCLCKSHVTGRTCGRCKEGFYNLNGPDVFGCRRCSCNAGGSISRSCNAVTGICTCFPGIGGAQCDRVASDEFYYPNLHQFKTELEDALTDLDRPAYFRHSENEFPSFSWRGYVVFSRSQNFIQKMIDVPRTTKYQLLFYYMLKRLAPVTALVKFIPTLDSELLPSGPPKEQTLDVRFRSTASWIFAVADFLVVRDNWGDTRQILLSQGRWKLTIAAPSADLLVDYLVLLPEEYYRPQNLQEEVSKPCELKNGEKYCAYFTYPSVDQDSFVTIEGEDSSVYGGIRRNQKLPDIPFQGLLLSGSRNTMSVRLPSTVQGDFVLIANYFHNAADAGVMNLVLRSGFQNYQAQMIILSCRYKFGCRQVAVDHKHKVQVFTADHSQVNTISATTRFTVALDSIVVVPLSKWNQQLIVPVEQCISNGFSCVQASYPIPTDAVRIETEDRITGGDRGPYYMLDRRASLKYLRVGEKTLHVSGSARPGRYYVVVHFYQPNYLAFLGKVVVSGESAASTLLKFHYCPHVSGCRAVGTSQYREGMIDSVYVGRQTSVLVSIVIPEDKDVWIDYVLLVPLQSFSLSLMETKPIDVTQDFIQDCGQSTFFLKDSSSQFCLRSAFTITTRFNNGALRCQCDNLGSSKQSCQSFGGQCICRPNVIGRKCDRCRSGYSGFPHCRKQAT